MAKKNDKRSFVMYDSFLEAMKHLNDKDFRECTMRIRDYALEGIEEESESPFVNIILEMAKPNLEAARRRYEACVENGKKGAEYGKEGGAPKGNKNASKDKQPQNQPQKQPLDVDVNANDDVYVNANDDVNVDVEEEVNAASTPNPLSTAKPSIGLKSSSGSSITNLIREIVNNSERLETGKSQPYSSSSNGASVVTAEAQENKSQLYPKSRGSSVASSTPRRREIEGGEYSMGDYMRKCIETYTLDLVDMRMGRLPQDDTLFWKAVDTYKSLYGLTDDKSAVKAINALVDEGMRKSC